MKTKTTISTIAIIAASITATQAGVTFNAPGLSGVTGSGTNYQSAPIPVKNEDGENYKKYRITGYSYNLTAGRIHYVTSSNWYKTNNSGGSGKNKLIDHNGNVTNDGKTVNCQISVSANSGITWTMPDLDFNAVYHYDKLTGSVDLAQPIELSGNIYVGYRYQTTMPTAAGSITLEGEAVNLDLIPTGSLNLVQNDSIIDQDMSEHGYYPSLDWKISKDSSATSSNSGGGGTGSNPVNQPDPIEDAGDAPNTGVGHSNNGHGNNIDGVDCSNPGKGWRTNGNFFDSDPNVDDEGHGGGAYPSQ